LAENKIVSVEVEVVVNWLVNRILFLVFRVVFDNMSYTLIFLRGVSGFSCL
jgi:hypothetical protein